MWEQHESLLNIFHYGYAFTYSWQAKRERERARGEEERERESEITHAFYSSKLFQRKTRKAAELPLF